MENKTYTNNIFRNYLLKIILTSIELNDVSIVDDEMYYYLAAVKLSDLELYDNPVTDGIYDCVIETAYLDAYKILYSKLCDCDITYLENKLFDQIASINDVDDLRLQVKNDSYLLEKLIKYSIEFIRSNDLKKNLYLKKIPSDMRYALSTKYPLFKNDINEYEEFSLDKIVKFYNEQFSILTRENGIIDDNLINLNLIDEIMGFLKTMNGFDDDNYSEIIHDLLMVDNKWSTYLLDNKITSPLFSNDDILERMKIFKEFPFDALIYEVSQDDSYLSYLLDFVLCCEVHNLYMPNDVVNSEIVNDNYEDVTSNKTL